MFNFFQKYRYAARSSKWPEIRNEHLNKNPHCIACGSTKKLEVHHIKPVHLYPELELDSKNLVTLCAEPCHRLFGHLMNFKSWNKDVIQDCKVYYNKLINRP
jgi:5-methylcytosine-specific restriction endonuclease McrA